MTQHSDRLAALGVLAPLLIGAGWFGLRLGPRGVERPATPESANLAAQGFVAAAVKKKRSVDVSFSAVNGASGAAPDAGDPDSWTVTGIAMAGAAELHWTVREGWDGRNNWRLKAIEAMLLDKRCWSLHTRRYLPHPRLVQPDGSCIASAAGPGLEPSVG